MIPIPSAKFHLNPTLLQNLTATYMNLFLTSYTLRNLLKCALTL